MPDHPRRGGPAPARHTSSSARETAPSATDTPARAAVVTVDPLLAAHLASLHTGVRTAVLTRLPGTTEGTLRDTDALLVLAGRRGPDGTLDTTAGLATTVYVGTDLDDARVWERAVALRVDHVVVLPDADAETRLRGWLREHLDGQP